MKSQRYDVYGAVAGVGLPVLGTVIEALRTTGSLTPGRSRERRDHPAAHLDHGDGALHARRARPAHRAADLPAGGAVRRRSSGSRPRGAMRSRGPASELFHAAQGLLGNVSAFTSTTAETAASVRETTATMTHLSQTATAAALTAETVIGLAEQAERTAERELKQAEASGAELVQLADEVRALSTKIETLNARMRDIFEVSGVMAYAADRAQKLAESVAPRRSAPARPPPACAISRWR